jgi:hypothetical protein
MYNFQATLASFKLSMFKTVCNKSSLKTDYLLLMQYYMEGCSDVMRLDELLFLASAFTAIINEPFALD